MSPVAHVLPPLSAPPGLEWAVSVGLATGLCAVFLCAGAARLAGGALCVAACAAGLSLLVAGSGPARPDLRLHVVTAGRAASPVELRVCALTAAGAPAPVPGPGRLLALRVDGAAATTVTSPRVVLTLAAGVHHIAVELVTAGHREFSPPLSESVTVTVAPGAGPLAADAACPG
jgi:hypothetical protein